MATPYGWQDALFSGGLLADDYGLSQDVAARARQQGMLNAGLALMAAGGRQSGQVNLGQALLQGLQAGQQGYESGIRGGLAKQKYAESQKARESAQAMREELSALSAENTPDSFVKRGQIFEKYGDYDNAQKYYDAAQKMTPKPEEGFTLSPGAVRFDSQGRQIASVAPESRRNLISTGDGMLYDSTTGEWIKAPGGGGSSYRLMTPAEVASAGLPPGTVAQIGPKGQVDIVNKPPVSALSPKQAQSVRDKIQTVSLARQQLQNVKNKFSAIQNTMSAGYGQGMLPTESGKQFDAAVDGLRTSIRQLTRTPGEGAMSDYESRLAQAQLPTRNAYESVTSQQIQQLEDMLNLIERGYSDLTPDMPQMNAPSQADQFRDAMSQKPYTQEGFSIRKLP